MEKRTDSPYPRLDRPVLAVIGLVLVASTAFFAWSDRQARLQVLPIRLQAAWSPRSSATSRPRPCAPGIQQIWVPGAPARRPLHDLPPGHDLEGLRDGRRAVAARTRRSRLKNHPIEKFGCSACHGGQGWAIDTDEAHGEVAHWEEPLLGRSLGEAYSLVDDKTALMQMNCNVCHRYDRETAGADAINLAKTARPGEGLPRLSRHQRARWHDRAGPHLRSETRRRNSTDYGRLSGQKTAFAWHVAHFKDPRALVQDTVMPNFHLSTKDAQALVDAGAVVAARPLRRGVTSRACRAPIRRRPKSARPRRR